MPATPALAGRHQRAVAALQAQAATFVMATWDRLGSWRDGDVEEWQALALPVVAAAQTQASLVTVAYLADYLDLDRLPDIDPEAVAGGVRGGTPPETVYRRPFETVWTWLSQDRPLRDAVAAGRARAAATARTDVQLAMTSTTRLGLADQPGVVGYRRVLSGASCKLCRIASTQRYHSDQLMPIHNRCDCGIAPIVGDRDPGQVINQDLLDQLKAEGAVDDITRQRRTRRAGGGAEPVDLAVHEHGEIGPVLTDAAHAFTGPNDI